MASPYSEGAAGVGKNVPFQHCRQIAALATLTAAANGAAIRNQASPAAAR